jgi:hypothetical protein
MKAGANQAQWKSDLSSFLKISAPFLPSNRLRSRRISIAASQQRFSGIGEKLKLETPAPNAGRRPCKPNAHESLSPIAKLKKPRLKWPFESSLGSGFCVSG